MRALKWKARKLIWAETSVRVWQRSHYPTICLHCSKKSQQTACWWQIQWSWTNKPQKGSLPLRMVCFCSCSTKSALLCARNALERALLLQDSFQLFSSIFGKLPTTFQIPREKSLKKTTADSAIFLQKLLSGSVPCWICHLLKGWSSSGDHTVVEILSHLDFPSGHLLYSRHNP